MKNFTQPLENFLELGIFENTNSYFRNKIKITNSIALVLTLWLYVPFIVICYLYFPQLILLPIFATFFTMSAFVFNYFKYYNVSRILVSLTGVTADVIFHSAVVSPGEDFVSVIFLIQFLFVLIPLVLFSLKELTLLISTSLAVFAVFVSVIFLHKIIIVDIDQAILQQGVFFNILVFAMPFTIYGVILPFLLSEKESEKRTLDLLQTAKQKELEAQEAGKALEKELQKMKVLQEENEKRKELDKNRDWAVQGIAKFNEILRSDNTDIKELSFSIIRDLVKYLGVNQGGLFLISEEEEKDKVLELQASIAYDRRKYIIKEILPGEGLVGACFLEKKTIFLTKLPRQYIKITSGLGGETPRCLLIVPMMMNNTVLGVLELASFSLLEKYQIEFVEKLGESIASSLSIARINARTKRLVDELKMQAEQQSSQEEEMMQNVEELRATQEESLRKEKMLIAELEKAKLEIKKLSNEE